MLINYLLVIRENQAMGFVGTITSIFSLIIVKYLNEINYCDLLLSFFFISMEGGKLHYAQPRIKISGM